jgi:hypothetical protein
LRPLVELKVGKKRLAPGAWRGIPTKGRCQSVAGEVADSAHAAPAQRTSAAAAARNARIVGVKERRVVPFESFMPSTACCVYLFSFSQWLTENGGTWNTGREAPQESPSPRSSSIRRQCATSSSLAKKAFPLASSLDLFPLLSPPSHCLPNRPEWIDQFQERFQGRIRQSDAAEYSNIGY